MPSINAELDAALVGCKDRAAEFDDKDGWRPMTDCGGDDVEPFINRAMKNLRQARNVVYESHFGNFDADRIKHLRDAVNISLLALSILERRTEGET
jgi:hypothetical protein